MGNERQGQLANFRVGSAGTRSYGPWVGEALVVTAGGAQLGPVPHQYSGEGGLREAEEVWALSAGSRSDTERSEPAWPPANGKHPADCQSPLAKCSQFCPEPQKVQLPVDSANGQRPPEPGGGGRRGKGEPVGRCFPSLPSPVWYRDSGSVPACLE